MVTDSRDPEPDGNTDGSGDGDGPEDRDALRELEEIAGVGKEAEVGEEGVDADTETEAEDALLIFSRRSMLL